MLRFSCLLLSFVLFTSCYKNKVIEVKRNPFEVMPVSFRQNVLLETFAQESLNETVSTTAFISDLEKLYPDGLYPVSLHRNDFLATAYSDYLGTKLGGLVDILHGSVSRSMVENTLGNEDHLLLLSQQNWAYAIGKFSKQQAPLSIALETSADTNGKGNLQVYIAHKEAIPGDTRIMVYMLENEVQPVFQEGAPAGFKHRHVLKNLLTAFDGDPIDLSRAHPEGEIIKKSYNGFDLSQYNTAQLQIVVFICTQSNDLRQLKVLNVQGVNFYGVHYWDI